MKQLNLFELGQYQERERSYCDWEIDTSEPEPLPLPPKPPPDPPQTYVIEDVRN